MTGFCMKSFFRTWAPKLLLIATVLAGCAAPIGVTKIGTQEAYLGINANALSGKEISVDTEIVLNRFDLTEQFRKDPAAVIAQLHKKAFSDERRDLYYALSELSFYYGEKLEKRSHQQDTTGQPWMDIGEQMNLTGYPPDYYLMSALYAYHYLLGPAREDPPNAYDRRFRVACDLYNGALGKGFATDEKGGLEFREGVRRLPIASLTITIKKESLEWPLTEFKAFLPADNYRVNGFSVRNRTPGLGLPLIAIVKRTPALPGEPAIPVTAFLRITDYSRDHAEEASSASLEFYSGYEDAEVTVNGRKVPLETDSTAPFAYKLNDPSIWRQLGIKRFFSSQVKHPELVPAQPYQPRRIPVVFVHGTASSPLWWAQMVNTLRSDPVLRERCQFWFFIYNSSVPIVVSAAALRDSLSEELLKLDPEGKDPALQEMVVIGHSQGGLLTKMTVVQTGDRLWHSLSDRSPDELDLTPETRQLLKKYLFFKPLPFVKRVVFIATPHRGSFLASGFARKLIRNLVSLPNDIVQVSTDVFSENKDKLQLPSYLKGKIPTSVDGMSSDNPVLITLAELPIAPGVKGNSIIAVKGEGDYHTGNDGVVEYSSAHIEGVESEFIVRGDHSCQGNPLVIEEVRRILREQLALVPGMWGNEMMDGQAPAFRAEPVVR